MTKPRRKKSNERNSLDALYRKRDKELERLIAAREKSEASGEREYDLNGAMINTIEVIRTIGFALDESVHAMMYYMPAKGAEPKTALCRLDSAKKHLARALYLINEQVERSKPKTRNWRPCGKIETAQAL